MGSKDFVITFSSSSVLYPCPSPRMIIAAMVAIRSATKGSPRKARMGAAAVIKAIKGSPRMENREASPFKVKIVLNTESRIMSMRGIRIIPTMLQKFGSLDSSKSAWFATWSGTGMLCFFPQMEPHTGPATIMANTPHKIPIIITQPKSTPSIVATRMGPGVGGMYAWPTASPANRGIA